MALPRSCEVRLVATCTRRLMKSRLKRLGFSSKVGLSAIRSMSRSFASSTSPRSWRMAPCNASASHSGKQDVMDATEPSSSLRVARTLRSASSYSRASKALTLSS